AGPYGSAGDVDPADPRLPRTVSLAGLLDADAGGRTDGGAHHPHGPADGDGAGWDAPGWAVPLGVDAAGRTVHLDLVADGPHLLVAGTTGAGKSELLQALVLGLAARRSPRDLALALVDFKGGASFGPCTGLPHVVGQVSDLDAGLAGRALAGLRAELHRREELLAAHGVTDLAALHGHADAPPRLVVVIDEFRALADDLPEFLPGLLRVAAQGRSLGVHLVLATQRPAGAVSADVRANVSARIALRVVDAADSLDVVDTAAAARIRPGVPGRAVLRLGAAAPVVLQCAHAGTPRTAGPVVRRAPAWRTVDRPRAVPTDRVPDDGAAGTDDADRMVAALRTAAARRGLSAGPAPWLPPLPELVTTDEAGRYLVPEPAEPEGAPGAAAALPVALGDDPDHQRRRLITWAPADGHLAVVGAARSGRTTTLLALARNGLDRGWHVHALVPRAAQDSFAPLTDHPGFGTLAGPDDPRRAARLLRRLTAHDAAPPAGAPPVLVVVDAVEQLRAALAGPDPWDPLAGALAGRGAAFALAADGATVAGLASRVGPRLVLLGRDAHADVVLGAPSGLAGSGGPPGRAAWLGDRPLVCQVLLPPRTARPAPAGTTGGGRPPVVVRPLPSEVDAASLAAPAGPTTVVLGVGGDAALPLDLDVTAGALVTGPRGSGRTTVLRLVARRLAATGRLAAVVSRDPLLRAEAASAPAVTPSAAGVARLLDELLDPAAGHPAAPGRAPQNALRVVLVDDVDALAQTCPLEADRLAGLHDPGDGRVLVASATTTGTLLAHRGVLAELRAARTGVVLHPAERGADEAVGTSLADAVEPGPPRPGRGALVVSGLAQPLQVARP
ncbi:FtsK/SpoIIIE domain-containing protein, partial [Isoptericola cucumis]|uniref:FtsK/SpoIIIE domain-containing protein n=1 Tax=Isoptericola cucumis TaxID=1776856 RepID=UPI00320A6ED2